MVRIENADLQGAKAASRSSFKKMCIASFFAEFVDKLTREKERNEALYGVLREGMEGVKKVEFSYSVYYIINSGCSTTSGTCRTSGRASNAEKMCGGPMHRPFPMRGAGSSARRAPVDAAQDISSRSSSRLAALTIPGRGTATDARLRAPRQGANGGLHVLPSQRRTQIVQTVERSGGLTMYFQDLILELAEILGRPGLRAPAALRHGGGAGTFHPATFLRVLGPEPWNAAYVEPSAGPTDGRYGENPNRLQHYYQFQVIMKPSPADIQDIYLRASKASASTPRSTTSASSRTTGSPPPWAPGAWAGRSGSTAWRSPSSPISSRWGASTFPPSPWRSPTASSASPCTSRTWTTSTTSSGTTSVLYGDIYLAPEREYSTYNFEEADAPMLRGSSTATRRRGKSCIKGRELV